MGMVLSTLSVETKGLKKIKLGSMNKVATNKPVAFHTTIANFASELNNFISTSLQWTGTA